ncbi:MAG: hypothetical protein K5705_09965 [Oscillospiraceae bacterium]|nr:hypothetical protein [Oscillospiraceae bacterium]
MRFKVRHTTKLFFRYKDYLLLVPFALLNLFVAFGFSIQDTIPTYILFGLIVFCIAAFFILLILYIIELFCGAKIIIESDSVEIRMLLRRKKIRFTEIEEVKYTHDEELVRSHRGRHSGPYRRRYYELRAKLTFFLTSGKSVCVNDKGTGYLEKRDRAKVDPSVNPDEDITLYQAYQCYCAAVDEYARQHGLQIPR